MRHDVFISHSSHDKITGDAVCAVLEQNGIRCWIAPRDILPGASWGESIVDAIHDARIMVLVFSAHANRSPQVEREIERAVSGGLVLIPLRIEDIKPTKSLEYFISSQHWLDAFTPPIQEHLQRLARVVRQVLAAHRTLDPAPAAPLPREETPAAPTPATGGLDRPATSGATYDGHLTDPTLSGWPREELSDEDQRVLSDLASSNPLELLRAIELIFDRAAARFDASGAVPWINNTGAAAPPEAMKETLSRELAAALQLAGRGLNWVSAAAAANADLSPRLGEVLQRAGRLFYRIGWLTIAGGAGILGVGQYFEDGADIIGIRRRQALERLAA